MYNIVSAMFVQDHKDQGLMQNDRSSSNGAASQSSSDTEPAVKSKRRRIRIGSR